VDAFGAEKEKDMGRRIESKPSQTADITCGCRAISNFESNLLYKSNDWVAPKLLPRKFQILIHIPFARFILSKLLGRRGMYEWIIARTKYIDSVFQQVSQEKIDQILIFGAGFDSRGVRFHELLGNIKVFELDAPTTQEMKIKQFRLRDIEMPSSIILIPINFEKDSISAKLNESGFISGKKTLVVLEGVLQYLKPEAAYETLKVVKNIVGAGSWLVFDYAHASVLRKETQISTDIAMMKELNMFGESWQFALDESQVESFLNKYDFELLDHKGPKELEEIYFNSANGIIRAKINGTQSIVKAKRK